MYDWSLEPGSEFSYTLTPSRPLAFLVIRGLGTSKTAAGELQTWSHKDFAIIQATTEGEILQLKADNNQVLRIIAIEVPEDPGYALYHK
jgi:redox-sensitive bicupin YhaK (pirin superfamily)